MDLIKALYIWLVLCGDADLQEAAKRIATLYGYESSTPAAIRQAAARLRLLAGMMEDEAVEVAVAMVEKSCGS